MDSKELGEKIETLRTAANLSQAELGKKIGCSQRLISWWECGQRKLTAEDLVKLAEVFKVSVDELLGIKIKKGKKKKLAG